MGDVGDTFNAMKDYSREKRANNRATSAEILKARGIKFDRKNAGVHLIVYGENNTIDFWPGTGRWACRSGNSSGRGVFTLAAYCVGKVVVSEP